MRILVTGAAGFIGSKLVSHFRQAGVSVFVDAESSHATETRRWPLSPESLRQVMQGYRPDFIVHAAGSGTVAKVAAQPALELPANLGAFLAVMQYVQEHAPLAHVALLSSAALYGDAPAVPQVEDQTREPISLYGLAKAQAEQLAAYYARHLRVKSTVVRLFSVYGEGLRKQLLWDAMTKFNRGERDFSGAGTELRDWVHVSDVCCFMDALMEHGQTSLFETYNCAGTPASIAEILDALAQEVGAGPVVFNGKRRPGDPACLVADCSKAHSLLNWRAETHWQTGVSNYARWFMSQFQK